MTTRTRVLLALAALVAGALAIYLAVGRKHHAKQAAGDGTTTPELPGSGGRPAHATGPGLPGPGPGSAAAVEHTTGLPLADGDGGVPTHTYVMDDGTLVRDHRRNGEPPVATTPTPPGQRTLDPQISAAVYRELTNRVGPCISKVPADARGADPFVYVNLTVDIDGGDLSTTDTVPVAHDVKDAAAGALVSCVRDALATMHVPAPGAADQTTYVLQYPIKIR